jgi:hypothetical protein
MLPFGVTIPATVPARSEIPEGLMNYPVALILRRIREILKIDLHILHINYLLFSYDFKVN